MANKTRNYVSFTWHNQMIAEELVNFVRVRIFLRDTKIIFYRNEKLIATDGEEFSKIILVRYFLLASVKLPIFTLTYI